MHLVYVSYYHLSPFLNSKHRVSLEIQNTFFQVIPCIQNVSPKLIYTRVVLFNTHFLKATLITINASLHITAILVFAEYLCGLIYYSARFSPSPYYTYPSAYTTIRSDLSYISTSWYACQNLFFIEKNELYEFI